MFAIYCSLWINLELDGRGIYLNHRRPTLQSNIFIPLPCRMLIKISISQDKESGRRIKVQTTKISFSLFSLSNLSDVIIIRSFRMSFLQIKK